MQRSKIYLKRKKTLVNILKVHYRKNLNIISHLVQSPRLQLSDGIRKGILWQGNKNDKLHKMIDSVDQLNIDSADVFCGTSWTFLWLWNSLRKVMLAERKGTDELYAIKILKKDSSQLPMIHMILDIWIKSIFQDWNILFVIRKVENLKVCNQKMMTMTWWTTMRRFDHTMK